MRKTTPKTSIDETKPVTIDYLVGGFRISLEDTSNTPGPRSHILGFTGALKAMGYPTKIHIASGFVGMSRFANIREGGYKDSGSAKMWVADGVRFVAAVWCGMNVFCRTVGRKPTDVIYERLAVFQSLSSFHAHKNHAFRVIEANGVLSRETAKDRKALKVEWYARWLEKRVLRKADLVIAVSDNLKSELIAFAGLNPDRILVVPNGIDADICAVPRTKSTNKTVGFVGAIVEWQHLDRLVRTISEFNEARSAQEEYIRLELIGDGPELDPLRELSTSLNMDDYVKFHGRVSHNEAIQLMRGWDVGFAGHEKSSSGSMYHSPLKIYEYAALGVSILCTSSADAVMLKNSGAKVHFIGVNGSTLESALAEALRGRQAMGLESIEQMRLSVEKHHGWVQRAQMVIEAIRIRETGLTDEKANTVA